MLKGIRDNKIRNFKSCFINIFFLYFYIYVIIVVMMLYYLTILGVLWRLVIFQKLQEYQIIFLFVWLLLQMIKF
jgi:hypothetical protein